MYNESRSLRPAYSAMGTNFNSIKRKKKVKKIKLKKFMQDMGQFKSMQLLSKKASASEV